MVRQANWMLGETLICMTGRSISVKCDDDVFIWWDAFRGKGDR